MYTKVYMYLYQLSVCFDLTIFWKYNLGLLYSSANKVMDIAYLSRKLRLVRPVSLNLMYFCQLHFHSMIYTKHHSWQATNPGTNHMVKLQVNRTLLWSLQLQLHLCQLLWSHQHKIMVSFHVWKILHFSCEKFNILWHLMFVEID